MRQQTFLVKSTINNVLDSVTRAIDNNSTMTSDLELSKELNVSRTTIREAISYVLDKKILQRSKKHKVILRAPVKSDYCVLEDEDSSKDSQIETFFMSLMMSGKLMPGDKFSELELAQKSGCTTITVREFLNRFSSHALIEKIPRCGWKVVELNENLILELTSFREMIELRLISDLIQLPKDNPVWDLLGDLLNQHQNIINNFESSYIDFIELDEKLHFTILDAVQNRYINKFYAIIFFTCRYYFLWDKRDKKAGIKTAINEHIAILSHVLSNNNAAAILSMKAHMESTQKNLLNCVINLKESTLVH